MITGVDKVQAIRDVGYRVSISHQRRVRGPLSPTPLETMMTAYEAAANGFTVLTHGGQTTVTVTVDDGEDIIFISEGIAWCSDDDVFVKWWGLELAVRRAIKDAPELRAVMKELAAKVAT